MRSSHYNQMKHFIDRLWSNTFADILVMYKIFHGMAPPLLIEFIKQNLNSFTWATRRCDYKMLWRESTFGQSAFSYWAGHTWNTIPTELTNTTSVKSFYKSIKQWSLENQMCHCLCCCCLYALLLCGFVFVRWCPYYL